MNVINIGLISEIMREFTVHIYKKIHRNVLLQFRGTSNNFRHESKLKIKDTYLYFILQTFSLSRI